MALLLVFRFGGQGTRIAFIWTRLIRHVLFLLSLSVVALAIAVVITTLGCPLVLPIGFAVLLQPSLISADIAAVALAAETRAADAKDFPASGADSWEQRDERSGRHHRRKAELDGGVDLWEAQPVTV
jgi:hypothetical protein